MEKYRRWLTRSQGLKGAAVALWVAWLVAERLLLPEGLRDTDAAAFRSGFAYGMIGALTAVLVRGAQTLRNTEKLRQAWVRQHDERMIAIRARAGMPMLLYASVAMLLAACVVSYTNETAFKTLCVAGLAQALLGLAAKAYFLKTM